MSIEQRENLDAILRQAAFPQTPASMTSGACSTSSSPRMLGANRRARHGHLRSR